MFFLHRGSYLNYPVSFDGFFFRLLTSRQPLLQDGDFCEYMDVSSHMDATGSTGHPETRCPICLEVSYKG